MLYLHLGWKVFHQDVRYYHDDKFYQKILVYHKDNINKKLWKDFEKGKIEKPKLVTERFRILLSDLGYSIDPAEFNLSYGEALSRQNILFPGALRLCRRLAQNARLYIVTNGIKQVMWKSSQTMISLSKLKKGS